jgi:phosphate transport system permease protein
VLATGLAVLLAVGALAWLVRGLVLAVSAAEGKLGALQGLLITVVVTGAALTLAWGMWQLQNWARSGVLFLLIGVGLYYGLSQVFAGASEIFAGEQVKSLGEILLVAVRSLGRLAATGAVPAAIIFGLLRLDSDFEETRRQRVLVDRTVRYILFSSALSAILIVFLILLFTMREAWDSIRHVGLDTMLLGTIWRPGSIIGNSEAQLGLVPMIIGSILSTIGAAALGVPISIGTAILLAEVAPDKVREVVRPAIELLAGIPSVVYGLFGMVVLAPFISKTFLIRYNTGYGLLNAAIILAVMIVPTITNITEDAIRAVPKRYKEGSLALGATHWQTIVNVILPAARSGIVAAIILGIGRALGETMALIMVIGNSIAIPTPLNNNPLTLFLSAARTLTGNIAVEIAYAAGLHRSALFFTGVLLFVMILLTNVLARHFMRERQPLR